jgi:hypothetical protein
VALAAGPLAADEGLLTDRPDFTETTRALAPGRVQLEGGFTHSDLGPRSIRNAPEALVRLGVLRGLELRLGVDYVWPAGRLSEGEAADGYAGAKLELPLGGAVGLALIPALTVPDFGEDDVDAELVLAWSRELASPWSVGGIVGHLWEDDRRRNAVTATVSLGAAIGQRLGTFFELAAEWSREEGAGLVHHGYTVGLGPDLQLDLHGGLGLAGEAPDLFIGAGFALRR